MKEIHVSDIEKRAFINGVYSAALSGAVINKVSPINGEDLTGISACDKQDIDRAVEAAENAFQSGIWSDLDPVQRKAVILRLADLMEEATEELATLDTLETGRSFGNYKHDSLPKAVEALRYFAEAVDKYYDFAIPPRKHDFAVMTREALGVVGIITPWNDPMVVSMWKVAPALLMGNSVIVKPAEQSSFSMIRVAALAKEAGVPDGVLNVVPGYGEVAGQALALHPKVSGIFFTGSSEVGKKIIQYSGLSNMKKVGLECGGKSPFIVSKNYKDLRGAAEVLAKNIFYNQGQICSAPSRVFLEEAIHDEFIGYLKEASLSYVPSNPFSEASKVGCVVNREQKEKVLKYIQLGLEEGANLYQPSVSPDMPEGAQFVLPTVLTEVKNHFQVAREEIFGPVVCIIKTSGLKESVTLANDSDFGLAASIWTDHLDEAYQVSRKLQAGIVHINSYGDDDNMAPFGGVKASGIGKDKSIVAFDEYSTLKTTWMKFSSVF